VGRPDDALEREADRVADAVMSSSDPKHEPIAAGQGRIAQRKIAPSGAHVADTSARNDLLGKLGAGEALPAQARGFFEPRFGRSFDTVRVHADARADAAARSVQARAFTFGSDVVFAAREYDPQSTPGRSLLAHELAHVAQQGDGATHIQRSLSVDPTVPTDPEDPLSTMSAAAFQSLAFSDMDSIVHSLCDLFHVDSTGHVVPSPSDACTDRGAIAGGAKPIGCCCLCALTGPGSGAWNIHVTGVRGPTTEPAAGGGGDFFLHPRSSDIQFGAWNTAGARADLDPVIVAGHEICGHGALIERGIHPSLTLERVDTNLHDPTVRVQNLIQAEQGLPGAARGLARGPHRGESFAHITIRDYPFADAAVPASEAHKIQLAKDFINAGETWVDIFGHSDHTGSPAAKLAVSQARADNVEAALTSGTRAVTATISRTFANTGAAGTGTITVAGNRFTRVEGRSDFDTIPGAPAAALRRVDIIMPTRPAGAQVPNPGTPTGVAPVGPASVSTFLRRRLLGNACDRLLARSAWS
jgi:Domain of unknown function (DUF4157)